ncbi:hypothetical protein ACFWNT_11250 [Streptomyces sp. NPDC058409]|uniref:hypothetical protein n=1 Tax=Streptomyces sp. NPDC058409 TaxID=3346484 RepID=UPI00365DB99D
MGDGFIRWYRELGKDSVFSEQVAAFDRCGVTFAHPETGTATVINVDGDDVPVSFEALAWLIGLRISSVTVNWWISPDTNLVGNYSHEPLGCEIQTFWLDGLNLEEVELVKSAVKSAIDHVSTPTRALVCDVQGGTDADDWDSAILYEGAELPGAVDSLLLRSEVSDRIVSNSGYLRGEAVGHNLTKIIEADRRQDGP